MLAIVNPQAARGRALEQWGGLRVALMNRYDNVQQVIVADPKSARFSVREALGDGERRFVAVGGDGTVNRLANDLVAVAPPEVLAETTLGAIGMGSSNDFHKPHQSDASLHGHPARLDFDRAAPRDVGRTTYWDDDGRMHVHRWLLNASIGTTATGNWLFNDARGWVGVIKAVSIPLGILGATISALVRFRGQSMTIECERGEPIDTVVRNLGIVKNPHFTGSLRYDSPFEPASGDFHVHLLADSSFPRTIMTLARLARGRFDGPGTSSWRARCLRVTSSKPFAVEADGETVVTRQVEFRLEQFRLRVCQ